MAYGGINKQMDAAAEIERNPARKHHIQPEYGMTTTTTIFSLSMEMSRLTQHGTAQSVLRDQIFRREQEHGNVYFPCLADHEQD